MFSALEVLDAEANLNAAPVVRQGAFQPKAKPRVRKGGAVPVKKPSSAPAPKTVSAPSSTPVEQIHHPENQTINVNSTINVEKCQSVTAGEPAAPEIWNKVGFETGPINNADLTETWQIHNANLTEAGGSPDMEVARSPINVATELPGIVALHERNVPLEVTEVFGSPIDVAAEAQQTIKSLEEHLPAQGASGSSHFLSQGAGILSQGAGMGSLTKVLHDAPSAFEELLASHAFKPVQSTRKKHEPRKRSHARMDMDGGPLKPVSEKLSLQQPLDHSDAFEPLRMDMQSHESEFGAQLENIEHTHAGKDDEGPAQLNEEALGERGAAERGVLAPSSIVAQELVMGLEDLPSSGTAKSAEASRKKNKPQRGRQDDDNPLHEISQELLPQGAAEDPSVEESTVMRSKAELLKKKKRGCDQTEKQQELDLNVSLNTHLSPPKETSNPRKTKFAKLTASASVNASQPAEEVADEVNAAKEFMQEAVVGNAVEPIKKKKRGGNQANESRDKGAKVISNTTDAAISKETKKAKRASLFAATASASASQPDAEVATEADGARESVQEAVVGFAGGTVNGRERDNNQAEEQQDNGENVLSRAGIPSPSRETSKRKRKKPARFADSTDDDEANIEKTSTQVSPEPAKKKKKNDSRVNKRQDNAENDYPATNSPEEEITKSKKPKRASFSATGVATTSQTVAEVAHEANGVGKSVPPAAEKSPKKKLKKCIQSRRRVDRRAMNPANPDLDPKKMTMKDIIRLAEAKEKLLKKGNAKKAKDGNEATANVPEKEHENYESTCLAPQVQIIDGRIVINQESLTVNAHPKDDIRSYKRVEETHAKLNYHSYMKRTPKQLWQKHETELFYEALREFGTNFAMIQHLFPGRTRKQVLLKYKKEERVCPLRVSEAMRLKPCETSHFMEVLSSMNLLPSEISEELENEEGSVPIDTTCSRKDMEDNNCDVAGVEKHTADGDWHASKLEESSSQSKNQQDHENNGSNPREFEAVTLGKPDDNKKHHNQEPPEPDEIPKPCESPKKEPTPPRKKKSLFSYQTSTIKS